MEFIVADREGREIGYLSRRRELDMEIGGENDFEISLPMEEFLSSGYENGYRIFCEGTEYGGIVTEIETHTDDKVILRGDTWRGLLSRKVLAPRDGESGLTVSGDLNEIIGQVLNGSFGDLMEAEEECGISTEFQFPGYCTLADGLQQLAEDKGCRLSLRYAAGKVMVGAVQILDYSEELEFGSDSRIQFTTCRHEGINHLICLGKNEAEEQLVEHLYVQENGTIDKIPFYTGTWERCSVLEISNAKTREELTEEGKKELKNLMSYTSMNLEFDGENEDIPIGDIVGGRDRMTGVVIKKPIAQKIIKLSGDSETIECKIGE